VTEQNQSGETVATGVFLTQGDKDEPVVKSDPLMATVVSNKKGNYPYGFRANRVLWRDSNLILKLYRDNTGGGPRTFWWIRDFAPMYINGDLEGLTEEVDVFGMVNDKAKVELWRHERMPIYLSFLLGKQERLDMLETLLQFAEQQEWILKNATKTVAEFLLSPPAPGTDAKPNADPKAVSSLRNTLEAELRFWVDLEPIFFQFMAELASAPQAEWQDLQWIWADRIYRTALDTFNSTTSMLDEDARQLRAVAEGRRRLGRINPYREHLITQKEESIL
jgi:CRISPR system Cascade subunit CasA